MAALAGVVSMAARDDVAVRMDAEMRDWARVYAGREGPRCVTSAEILHRSVTPDPTPTLSSKSIQRAGEVEEALKLLKTATGYRRTYWRVLMTRYRSNLVTEHASKRLRMSDRMYRQRMHDAYRWLDGRLSSLEA